MLTQKQNTHYGNSQEPLDDIKKPVVPARILVCIHSQSSGEISTFFRGHFPHICRHSVLPSSSAREQPTIEPLTLPYFSLYKVAPHASPFIAESHHSESRATPLLSDVTFTLTKGQRACLVGRNGSGKSTLLKIIAGLTPADRGTLFQQPSLRVGYLSQDPDVSGYPTVHAYIHAALRADETEQTHRVDHILSELDLSPTQSLQNLSGGEKRRAALAHLLIGSPDIMLLDEPTNHLDLPRIQWLEAYLCTQHVTCIVISHDRAFLSAVTNTMLWLDRGSVHSLPRGFTEFEAWSHSLRQEEERRTALLDKQIAQETEWANRGVKARQKRNVGRLQRLQHMRRERANMLARVGHVDMASNDVPLSGRLVIEAKNISVTHNDRTLFHPFSLRILRGDRIGLIGANGSGKTTLLNVLMTKMDPTTGIVRHGTKLHAVFLDQMRHTLDPEKTVQDILANGNNFIDVRGSKRHLHGYMKDFLFEPHQARSPVKALSGGERNRLLLAWALAQPSNLLVLDEPTNDLDTETLDRLTDYLSSYDGTVLVVSHDRDFLDQVVTASLVFEDGAVREYPGGYSDSVRQSPFLASFAEHTATHTGPRKDPTVKNTSPKAPKRQRKLSYADNRRLTELPTLIEKTRDAITSLEQTLSQADLYTRDPRLFEKTTQDLGEQQHTLSRLEDEWLTLEMKREALEHAAER